MLRLGDLAMDALMISLICFDIAERLGYDGVKEYRCMMTECFMYGPGVVGGRR